MEPSIHDAKKALDASSSIDTTTETTTTAASSVQNGKECDTEKGIQETSNTLPPEQVFPEGGLQGWMTLAGATLIQYSMFGYINAFGVYEDFYIREYLTNFTPSDIGWIGGVQIFLNFSMGIITGRAFDKGYFYHLAIAGTILQAVALFTLSITHQNSYYQVFLSHGLCLGLACGLSYVPSLSIVGHYFRRQRPLAMGIVSAGSALGAFLHPIMLNKLFNGPLGFHNGVRVSAALNLFLLIIALLLMRTRLPPKEGKTPFPFVQFLKEPAYGIAVTGVCLAFCGLFFSVFYLQLDAVQHGVDENLAFYSLSILNAASIIGRTLPPVFAPRLGVFNLLVILTVGTGIVTLCMAAIKDAAGTVVFAIFYGFFSGGAISLSPAMLGALSKNVEEIGSRIGVAFACGGVLGLFATPIAGALLTSEYHWIRAILYAGITLIASGLTYIGSRHFVAKKRGTQIV